MAAKKQAPKAAAKATKAPKAPKTTKAEAKAVAGRGLNFPGMPKPGSKLEREYKGKTYTAKVLRDGFEYEGKKFDSLTAIARKITGVKFLSGPQFFGIK